MKKIMLIYPPGDVYQRGEDRCQLNINSSSANAVRACNDLGYASAILKKRGYSIFLKDYQNEKLKLNKLLTEIEIENPDVVFISITNATIFEDLEIANKIKQQKPDISIILKGAIFYSCSDELLSNIDLKNVDYLIGGEEEFIIGDLIDSHFNNRENLKLINGIIYKENDTFIKNPNGK